MDDGEITAVATHGRPAQRLRQVMDETDRFLRSAARSGDEKADALRAQLATHLREMREQLDEFDDTVRYRARRAVRAADHAVHAQPYGAIGVAAALGVLLGVLAARGAGSR